MKKTLTGLMACAVIAGTLAEAIIKDPSLKSVDEIQRGLSPLGLIISNPLGFNNTYALAVKSSFADRNGLRSISDLARVESMVRAAFSYEFMDRKDGYKGMVERYRLHLNPEKVSRMEHSLSYQAIDENAVDVIDVYSTDAKIKKLNLRVLRDDLAYFPSYQAVWVATRSFVDKYPTEWRSLRQHAAARTGCASTWTIR